MRVRQLLVTVLTCSFFCHAAGEARAQVPAHSTTPVNLHQTLRNSVTDGAEAREFVGHVIARPGVQKELGRIGVSADAISARVARLTDEEAMHLREQLMSPALQQAPAGRMDTMTAYIIGVALGLVLLVVLIAALGGGATPIYYY